MLMYKQFKNLIILIQFKKKNILIQFKYIIINTISEFNKFNKILLFVN